MTPVDVRAGEIIRSGRWSRVRDRIRLSGYRHLRTPVPWQPLNRRPEDVARLFAIARAIASYRLPSDFEGGRLKPQELAGLGQQFNDILDGMESMELGQPRDSGRKLYKDAALFSESFLAKYLAILEPKALLKRADPKERIDLDRLWHLLEKTKHSPLDPALYAARIAAENAKNEARNAAKAIEQATSPAEKLEAEQRQKEAAENSKAGDAFFMSDEDWEKRGTLPNAFRDIMPARITAAHMSPDPNAEETAKICWCVLTFVLALVEKEQDALIRCLPFDATEAADADMTTRASAGEAGSMLVTACDFTAFIQEKRTGFTGRGWLFDAIDAELDSMKAPALLITGAPGMGKSAFMAELAHRNPHGRVLAAHFCMADRPDTTDAGVFVGSVAAQLAAALPEYGDRVATAVEAREALVDKPRSSDPMKALEVGILGPLGEMTPPTEGPNCILVDGLDEAAVGPDKPTQTNIPRLLASRLHRFPAWLKVVATTRADADIMKLFQGNSRMLILDPKAAEVKGDLEAYLRSRLHEPDFAGRLSESRTTLDAACKALLKKSEGNFLYLRQALAGVVADQYSFARLGELPPGLYGLYEAFFRRNFPMQEAYQPARALLECVVAAYKPIPKDALSVASGLEREYEFPRVMRLLSQYLTENDGCIQLFHKSMLDWLASEDNEFRASGVRGHERLAEYCLAEYRKGVTRASVWVMNGLVEHLCESNRLLDVGPLLADVFDWACVSDLIAAGHFEYLVLMLCIESSIIQRELKHQCAPAELSTAQQREEVRRLIVTNGGAIRRDSALLRQLVYNDPRGRLWKAQVEAELRRDRAAGKTWLRLLNRAPTGWNSGCALDVDFSGQTLLDTLSLSPTANHIYVVVDEDDRHKVLQVGAFSGEERIVCELDGGESVQQLYATPDGHYLILGGAVVWERNKWLDPTIPEWVNALSDNDDKRAAIWLWDLQKAARVATLKSDGPPITSMALSPNARWAVSCGRVRETVSPTTTQPLPTASWVVEIWDLANKRREHVLHPKQDMFQTLSGMRQALFANRSRQPFVLLTAAEHEKSEYLTARTDYARSYLVALSADARLILTGGGDKVIQLWDRASGQCVAELSGHADMIAAIAMTPDGRWAVSSSFSETHIRLWDLASRQCAKVLEEHVPRARALCISDDGTVAVSADGDDKLRVWDLGAGLCTNKISGKTVSGMAMTPDARRIVTKGDERVKLWDLTDVSVSVAPPHSRPVEHLQFSGDGQRLVSAGTDGHVVVWSPNDGKPTRVLDVPTPGECRWMALFRQGTRLAQQVGHTAYVWDLDQGKLDVALPGEGADWRDGLITPDERRLVRVGHGNEGGSRLGLWDLRSGQLIWCESSPLNYHGGVLTPDARFFICEAWPELVVWDLERRCQLGPACKADLKLFDRATWAISPDGQTILAKYDVNETFEVVVRDLLTHECLATLKHHYLDWEPWVCTAHDSWHIKPNGNSVEIWQSPHQPFEEIATLPKAMAAAMRVLCTRCGPSAKRTVVGEHYAFRGDIVACAATPRCLACGLDSGHVDILAIENSPLLSIVPRVTATRLWMFGDGGEPGRWDSRLTVLCWWCGRRFPLEEPLPLGQHVMCPHEGCGRPLELAPWVCDNRKRC